MMKKLFFLLSLFGLAFVLTNTSFANEKRAMVIVLEAPLFSAPDWRSPVLMNLRQGQQLKLLPGQMPLSDYESGVGERHLWSAGGPQILDTTSDFWMTLDRNGTTAYIPKKYVKIIFDDERELQTSVSPFLKDPTDYRLAEPLPPNYPFYDPDRRRAGVSFLLGPAQKINYNYSRSFQAEQVQPHRGVQVLYQRSISFDPTERFYFGGLFQFSADQTLISFDNDSRARESRGVLGLGPYLSFDMLRDDKNTFTIGGGIGVQWNRHLITASTRVGDLEERLFNGFSLRPKLQAFYQRREVFPNLNFTAGMEMESNLPYSLKANSAPQLADFWNRSNDTLEVPFGVHFALMVGFITAY